SSRPLSVKTKANPARPLKVHFKLPVTKAFPTVSVTNANAACVHTVHSPADFPVSVSSPSTIPFPSSPIPCPSRKRAISEDAYDSQDDHDTGMDQPMDVDEPEPEPRGNVLPFHRRISHIDILRRRSRSCLATSFFHSDVHSSRKPHHAHAHVPDRPAPPLHSHSHEGPAKKKPAIRRESMSAGTPPSSRTARKAKRVLADAQFLASMHCSIAQQVRSRMNDGKATGVDECAAQDAVLVERIWRTLLDMGYKPVPIDDSNPAPGTPAPSPPPLSPNSNPAREAAERAARRTLAVSSTPLVAQDLPQGPAETLSVPQLVAVLTMRHRDRSTTRPRSASKKRIGDERPSRSPLSAVVLPP
ncbi:hypothetical protein C8Q80DRAFT_1080879, partial [Daedaleopsis nitida]